jgi:hypothetical protein
MTRRVRYDPYQIRLYGVQEAADYLGLSRRNVTWLLAEGKIAEPVARLACGPIWSESQLDEMLFSWRDNPRRLMDPEQAKQMTLTKRLRALERRWALLVAAAAERDSRRRIVAVWRGEQAVRRHKQGRSARATVVESRKALAEAKLLRLVANLRDEDPVFRGIAAELDEMANLRKQLDAIKQARAERTVEAEAIEAHGDSQ